jgi:peptidyl-prolyl cis-trans isomerase B (cyclophilin B)
VLQHAASRFCCLPLQFFKSILDINLRLPSGFTLRHGDRQRRGKFAREAIICALNNQALALAVPCANSGGMRFLTLLLVGILGCSAWSAERYEPPTAAEIAATTATVSGAIIRTPQGDITVTLFPASAPVHVANFVKLARAKFYDGLAFHRVEPGFVIQGGDPFSRLGLNAQEQGPIGTGGPGYTIKLEAGPTNPEKHLPGTLAMARNQDPDSADSQFYLTCASTPHLNGGYTVFGRIQNPADLAIINKIKAGDRFSVEIIDKKP